MVGKTQITIYWAPPLRLQPSPFVAVTATRQFIVLPSVTHLILHGLLNDSAKVGSSCLAGRGTREKRSVVIQARRGDGRAGGRRSLRGREEKKGRCDGGVGAGGVVGLGRGGRCGRDDSSSGGVLGSFRTGDDLFVRRNRGCVVLLVTLRITCACGRGPARHVCAAAGPVVAGRGIPCARPALRPPTVGGRARVSLGLCACGLWARACRIRGGREERVPCSGRPRPDAARGPGVVSADSCGPGAARGPASEGSDSRGGRLSSPWGPLRAAPPEGCRCRFPSFYYSSPAWMLWFFLVHLILYAAHAVWATATRLYYFLHEPVTSTPDVLEIH
ncbi:hypothetical protein C2845_PM07G26490 [Panicum miliaceum]|uniref:Uncharacterized protein n=1 Tax=Panicum miliaceum TaxID=4540 RepID=A0A3L6SQN2_PANMI|nr:hypothetical protein C2845_PM07G26490 [Panicum miliaceum]